MKQLRENFGKVKEELEKGNSFLLLYRSHPLAEIKPVNDKNFLESDEKKTKENIKQLKKLAGGLHLEQDLSPGELNKLYDQHYHEMLS